MTRGIVQHAKFMCQCSECRTYREIPLPLTDENVHQEFLPWVFSLIDPPVVEKPRMALVCEDCAKKIYGPEFYEDCVTQIRAGKPN